MKKLIKLLIAGIISITLLTGCAAPVKSTDPVGTGEEPGNSSSITLSQSGTQNAVSIADKGNVDVAAVLEKFGETELNEATTTVVFNGQDAQITGLGAALENGILTISTAGSYDLSGSFSGQIRIDTEEKPVQLNLNGLTLEQSTTSPIYVVNSKTTLLNLVEGSNNLISDCSPYAEDTETDKNSPETERLNGAIYSKDDLIITGSGSLKIVAENKSGILVKDDLIIEGGQLDINAAINGLKGKDLVFIKDGTLSLNAGTEGVDSDTLVAIKNGNINIVAGADGLHSDNTLQIDNGNITIAAKDDGCHADVFLTINGGDIAITESYEGIEALDMVLNGGNILVNAGDDGVNVSQGSSTTTDTSSAIPDQSVGSTAIVAPDNTQSHIGGNSPGGMGRFMGGGMGNENLEGHGLIINGGQILINSGGDGLDSNGSIWMNGGAVVVNGPTENANCAIDYNGEFIMTGGYLLAAGSSGMAQAPGMDSSVNSLVIGFETPYPAGSRIEVIDEQGKTLMSHILERTSQCVVFASTDLTKGKIYEIQVDSKSYKSVTLTDTVTTIGSIGGFGGGRGMPPEGSGDIRTGRPGEGLPPGTDRMAPPSGLGDRANTTDTQNP